MSSIHTHLEKMDRKKANILQVHNDLYNMQNGIIKLYDEGYDISQVDTDNCGTKIPITHIDRVMIDESSLFAESLIICCCDVHAVTISNVMGTSTQLYSKEFCGTSTCAYCLCQKESEERAKLTNIIHNAKLQYRNYSYLRVDITIKGDSLVELANRAKKAVKSFMLKKTNKRFSISQSGYLYLLTVERCNDNSLKIIITLILHVDKSNKQYMELSQLTAHQVWNEVSKGIDTLDFSLSNINIKNLDKSLGDKLASVYNPQNIFKPEIVIGKKNPAIFSKGTGFADAHWLNNHTYDLSTITQVSAHGTLRSLYIEAENVVKRNKIQRNNYFQDIVSRDNYY